MKNRLPILPLCIIFILSGTVQVAASGITVNNYVLESEKAFTADDLRRLLEEGKDVSGDDNDPLSKRWEEIMSVSGNVSGDESKDGRPDNAKENEKSKDNEDKKDTKDNKDKENGLYVPKEGDEWMLLLVNKQNPIPDDYSPELVDVNGSIKIRKEIAVPLAEMFDAAEEDGISLMVCSAYRSHEYQQGLFDRKIRNYTGKGLSYLDAFRIGSYSVIIPGTSEHELGMALDIVTPKYMNLNEGFARTRAGKWLKKNAYKYGFILRYPEGKEYITGIIFEPWHYRYVGKEAAKAIKESGLTLEEYVEEIGYQYN